MKMVATVFCLLAPSFAFSAQVDTCLFGQQSRDFKENFSDLEKTSLKYLQAQNSFSEVEVSALTDFFSKYEGRDISWDYIQDNFFDRYSEWSISTYKNLSNEDQYFYVGGFPGDNEYGLIYLKDELKVVADVGDGEVYNCRVNFSNFEGLALELPDVTDPRPRHKAYDCYFGNDMLSLLRDRKFEFGDVSTQDYFRSSRSKLNFKDRDGQAYRLVFSVYDSRPSRATVTMQSPPYLVLAEYVDGLAKDSCARGYYD